MVYSVDILGTETFSAQAGPPEFSAQAAGCSCPNPNGPYDRNQNPAVGIYYNCCGIHTIAGPTPTMDISTSVQRTEAGIPTLWTTKITLTGKVVRGLVSPPGYGPYGSGIKPVMSGINDMRSLFNKGSCGDLDVYCISNNTFDKIFSASGLRVVDITFNRSDDNWVYTADYTVNLEYLQPGTTGWYIKDYTDSWNVEPLEDYYLTDYNVTATQKSEWDNPNLKPIAATANNLQPGSTQTQGQTGANNAGTVAWRDFNVPRFKVSHTVSAVGIPSGTGYCLNISGPESYSPAELDAFLNAQSWVQKRASVILSGTPSPPITNPPLWSPLATGYLYNHVRSTKFDIQSASYEITDSFLAMPTGIMFLENYEIEISTDDKFIHTVKVQGEVEGLSIANRSEITGVGVQAVPPVNSVNSNSTRHSLKLDLDANRTKQLSVGNFTHKVSDIAVSTDSAANILSSNRYANALSGWIYDIKPYVYRRACAAMNSVDRAKGYVNPTNYTAATAPNNPIYSKHGLLNIIPISTSEGHNTRQGKISYNYEFNNKFMIISGTLYENISIEDTGPADVIAEAFVLGRSLGPILQSLGTKTATKKQVTIEVGVVPPSTINGFFLNSRECPLWTGGSVYSTIATLVEGLKPFGDRPSSVFGNSAIFGRNPAINAPGIVFTSMDNHSWDPSAGRYVRTVGWIYQQCNNTKNYLDN